MDHEEENLQHMEILKRRYASGDITREQFLEARELLRE